MNAETESFNWRQSAGSDSVVIILIVIIVLHRPVSSLPRSLIPSNPLKSYDYDRILTSTDQLGLLFVGYK